MTARARMILARAERRLTQHIARHGINDRALSICAHYERLYAEALNPTPVVAEPSAWDDLDVALAIVRGAA